MILPEDRYSFSSKKRRQGLSGKFFLILIIAAVVIGGSVFAVFNWGLFLQETNSDKTDSSILYELWQTRQYTAIIDRCRALLQENPMNPEALVFYGFANFYEGVAQYSFEDKVEYFDNSIFALRKAELIEKHPFPGPTQYVLGKAYYHKGRFYMDLALEYLQNSIDMGYIGEDTYEYLGLAYSELEQYENSAEAFLKAAEENPSDILFLTLAQTYYKMDDMQLAEEYLIRTINKTEDVSIEEKSRFLLAQIYMDDGELIKAENQYQEVLKDNTESAEAHFNLGKIYENMGDTIKARAEWRNALKIDPSHYGARLKYYD